VDDTGADGGTDIVCDRVSIDFCDGAERSGNIEIDISAPASTPRNSDDGREQC
jgi:hypothetical protein